MRKSHIYILLLMLSILFIMPFVWTFLSAVKSEPELWEYPPKFIPDVFRWENFVIAWNSQPFETYTMNTVTVVLLSTFGQVISSSLVAYGFARFDFKGRNFLFILLLSTMMIPWEVKMIPLYMEFNALGWLNTLKPLIIPAFFSEAFFVFLLRQYIMTIPKELDEAAKMDGAGPFRIYWSIHLPLMIPALILVGTFHFMNSWNDYLGPLIFLNDQSQYTLTLGLAMFKTTKEIDILGIASITTLLVIPPLVLFFFAQKHIVEGTTAGGVKG
ncbi:carbohydrate ABC transporter permease [Vibrio sp. S9_S30]|uniref:carbohydrate ABC transporter permease n=1 Tax=Vibrio sp. S9_S30 TaxID=2720226 RepID=UPI00168018E0|nr:carbohydrate ABC transporter permease [Vibrio sp. S9_S30]MBD1557515.1 carbohydrate ABC transporter permease [Vibrio sp. S9_S30]